MPALARSRRLARLVTAWILLWLAVLQVNALRGATVAWSPAAQHAQAGHDCDEQAPAHGKAHGAAGHFVQCPGCLFATAPAPQAQALAPALHLLRRAAPVPQEPAPRGERPAQPPARGPPAFS